MSTGGTGTTRRTAHDDPRWRMSRSVAGVGRFEVRRGTLADYHAMARWHYRAGRPATCVLVLTAWWWPAGQHTRGAGTSPVPLRAGVLVVSMPTLNARWRPRATVGTSDHTDRAAAARWLNCPVHGVRCISRVVTDPRVRGLGVATMLVAAYLRRPLTTRTEAVAAMGPYSGFFARAGMTPCGSSGIAAQALAPSRRDAALTAALSRHRWRTGTRGIRPWQLTDAAWVARRAAGDPALADALRRWCRASRATAGVARGRACKRPHLQAIVAAAAKTVGTRTIAYIAGPGWGTAASAHTQVNKNAHKGAQ